MFFWLMIPVGVVIIWKAEAVYRLFGRISWAEQYFGSTISFIQLCGLALTLLSIMWVSGGLKTAFMNTVGVFFGA